jgi:hypothetical protein
VRQRRSEILFLLATSLLGCTPSPPRATQEPAVLAPARCIPRPARLALDAFVRGNRGRYAEALVRARAFLDGLDVDPIALRAAGIKGKKKLAEALDVYARLLLVAAPEARPALLARVEALARPTREDRYHDMLSLGEREFHEDATSYLRAAFLLDRMGLDVSRYRAGIAAMKGRLDGTLRTRGPHQRRAFHGYYRHFGLEEPFPLEGALEGGLIAARADPDRLSRMDVYALTHEVYAAYDFGERLEEDAVQGAATSDPSPRAGEEPFAEPARLYLRGALPKLATAYRERRDPDLVAELATCLRYLRFTGDPAFAEALGYLLDAQNADGSWGSYAAARARLGEHVKEGLYLHTTMVAVEALSLGFESLFRRGEGPECP